MHHIAQHRPHLDSPSRAAELATALLIAIPPNPAAWWAAGRAAVRRGVPGQAEDGDRLVEPTSLDARAGYGWLLLKISLGLWAVLVYRRSGHTSRPHLRGNNHSSSVGPQTRPPSRSVPTARRAGCRIQRTRHAYLFEEFAAAVALPLLSARRRSRSGREQV